MRGAIRAQSLRAALRRVQVPRVAARLLKADWTLPQQPSVVRIPAAAVSPQDVRLCKRLIEAYRKSSERFNGTDDLSPIWRRILEHQYRELTAVLDTGDSERLAGILARMFSMPFLEGISSNHMGGDGLYRRALALSIALERLARLAEFVGATRMANPEQGPPGSPFEDGLSELVRRIEERAGSPISVPPVGAPVGIAAGNSVITKESPEDVYVALKVDEKIRTLLPGPARHIVEIGAGFGGTAYWLLQKRIDIRRYTIIDLPIVNVIQGYYLGTVFGPDHVALFGEPVEAGDSGPSQMIHVLPTFSIRDADAVPEIDVLLNADSMPEMTERTVTEYLTWARRRMATMFCSFNHEADAHSQTYVPEMVGRVGGFTRVCRDRNWIREGYVDEVYLSVTAPLRLESR
jgi:hypothetical protein